MQRNLLHRRVPGVAELQRGKKRFEPFAFHCGSLPLREICVEKKFAQQTKLIFTSTYFYFNFTFLIISFFNFSIGILLAKNLSAAQIKYFIFKNCCRLYKW